MERMRVYYRLGGDQLIVCSCDKIVVRMQGARKLDYALRFVLDKFGAVISVSTG